MKTTEFKSWDQKTRQEKEKAFLDSGEYKEGKGCFLWTGILLGLLCWGLILGVVWLTCSSK